MLRRAPFPLEVKFASGGGPGTFSGYGAIFGNVDAYGDVIEKGAFRDSLDEWRGKGKLPPMLLQHGGGFFGGGADDLVPVGIWTAMDEDARGLKVEGRLFALETDRGKYLHAALKEGALDGLSIGYRAKEWAAGTKPEEPRRRLKKVELFEVSLVTFPANDKARVASVKASDLSERDVERFLRDQLGLSAKAARAFMARGWRAAAGLPDLASADFSAVARGLKARIDRLNQLTKGL